MEGRRSNPRTRRRMAWAIRGASGMAVASVVSIAAAADGPRAAVLLPPRVGDPAPAAIVARGAIDDNPLATTPVVRRTGASGTRPLVPPTGTKSGPAPDWLSGIDPNVIPAGGSIPAKATAPMRLPSDSRPSIATPPPGSPKLTPPPPLFTPGEPNPLAKGVEAFKGFATPTAPPGAPGAPQAEPRPGDPLQGTAANGAPVLAGPPAWRWYGYGSVTPGANPYAPNGQYPRGSANWHSVTRATPGAFPVPVVNPFRGGPGAEPPSYVGPPAATPRPVAAFPMPVDMPPPRMTPLPATTPVFAPSGPSRPSPAAAEPAAVMPPPFIPLPTSTPLPTATPLVTAPPVAVAPPPFMPIPLPVPPSPLPTAKAPEPLAVIPLPIPTVEPPAAPRSAVPLPVLPPLAVMPAAPMPLASLPAPPVVSSPVVSPPALPTIAPVSAPAASEDEVRWQSNPTNRPGPMPGTWMPPAERSRPAGQPGASLAPRLPIARGQIGDEVQPPTADPVDALVQAVCRGRATGIDVRHTGPRRVTVCFETRTQTDATALVRDLSARPELAPYEINYCVLVK